MPILAILGTTVIGFACGILSREVDGPFIGSLFGFGGGLLLVCLLAYLNGGEKFSDVDRKK